VEEAQATRWYRPATLQASAVQATSALHATERVAVEQASPSSSCFATASAAPAALAVAVFIAQKLAVQHAFWVVLDAVGPALNAFGRARQS